MRKLSKEQKRDIAAISAMKDEDIDVSDMPEALDWSRAVIGKFYRPPKKAVTIRLDADVLEWLKGYGKGYQTRANLLLRNAMTSTKGRVSGNGTEARGKTSPPSSRL
ncbi:MAG TPA: BrnA antitoxin family protein [Candidatus Sulfotelmatobacter sp.]|nr:BrnA antitoxin family protein [Candidatus Sulfotelmatobacter sp.]